MSVKVTTVSGGKVSNADIPLIAVGVIASLTGFVQIARVTIDAYKGYSGGTQMTNSERNKIVLIGAGAIVTSWLIGNYFNNKYSNKSV